MSERICRIGVFYDGTYFGKVSTFYAHHHERQARINMKGLHEFITAEVAKNEGIDQRLCTIVDASYFRGRLSAQQASDQNKLFSERVLEDVLMGAEIKLFQKSVIIKDGRQAEKGIDVWLALEAYEMASLKKYDVCVLITGDGDFVPLVKKLNTLGSRVMLVGWDFEFDDGTRLNTTRVSTALIEQVNYPVMMHTLIDSRERRKDALVDGLFVSRNADSGGKSLTDGQRGGALLEGEQEGVIERLVADKGFGFIKPDAGGENIFFHKSVLDGVAFADLEVQEAVSFTVAQTARGLEARDVRSVER